MIMGDLSSGLVYALGIMAVLLFVLPIVFLGLGVASFIVAWALWRGKRWAWYLCAVLRGLGAVSDVVSGNAFALLVDLAVLAYLIKATTQTFFKVKAPWSW